VGKKNPKTTPFSWDFVTLPEEDRATDIGKMLKNLVMIAHVALEICLRTDRQTDRQTCSSQYLATAPAGEVTVETMQAKATYCCE